MATHSTFSRTNRRLVPVLSPASFTFEKPPIKDNKKEKKALDGFISNNLEHANHMLDEANSIIRKQEARIHQLEKLMQTDELTNLMNRRAFVSTMNKELAALRRQKNGNSLLVLIDMDDFSEINKKHGRSIGDAYLQTVASVLINEVRTIDSVARLENDRFALLFTQISTKDAGKRLQTLQAAIEKRVMHHHQHSLPLKASFGYAIVEETKTADQLLIAADMKLYGDKARRKMRG